MSSRDGIPPNQRTKLRAARRKHAIAQAAAAAFEKIGERQAKLIKLFRDQRGKCHICGEKAVLDGKGGGGNPESAVSFRLGSGFGQPGRVRYRVMVHRKCADARSDEIQQSIPVEERWRRSGREPTEFYSVPSPLSTAHREGQSP